tara:strand:+ start:258 stop:1025 length:768 start_codon:yes stop_codon:yes gene_type:complete
MKAVILAGGLGTRISEESHLKPKPMIYIGDRPIIWHIMKTYSFYGVNEFIICCGYKGYLIKEYFANYFLHTSNVTFDMTTNTMEIHKQMAEPWKVTLVDTGDNTQTGGRLKRIQSYLDDEDFCFTYGDGLTDSNIAESIKFHKEQGLLATLTAIKPPGRFGAVNIRENKVNLFEEKPKGDNAWVNGGYFVLSPDIFEYLHGDETVWEKEPLEKLSKIGQLSAYLHDGFWKPMDTLRDKVELENLWKSGAAPWKKW